MLEGARDWNKQEGNQHDLLSVVFWCSLVGKAKEKIPSLLLGLGGECDATPVSK